MAFEDTAGMSKGHDQPAVVPEPASWRMMFFLASLLDEATACATRAQDEPVIVVQRSDDLASTSWPRK